MMCPCNTGCHQRKPGRLDQPLLLDLLRAPVRVRLAPGRPLGLACGGRRCSSHRRAASSHIEAPFLGHPNVRFIACRRCCCHQLNWSCPSLPTLRYPSSYKSSCSHCCRWCCSPPRRRDCPRARGCAGCLAQRDLHPLRAEMTTVQNVCLACGHEIHRYC